MHTTKRGEPLPINQALNRPRAKLGLDLSAWMFAQTAAHNCWLEFPGRTAFRHLRCALRRSGTWR
jgi:hypothetical protein